MRERTKTYLAASAVLLAIALRILCPDWGQGLRSYLSGLCQGEVEAMARLYAQAWGA